MAKKDEITAQRELLYQLITSEERYQNFMNAATDLIFINNLKGEFLDVNYAACNALGYTHKEITSMSVWDIEIGFSKETINELTLKLTNGPFNVEGRHKRKDGTSFPVDVRMSAFKAMDETLILAIVRDISDQKCAESTIKRLSYALEKIPQMVVIMDKTGNIEYANAKVLEQSGYHCYEIIGENFSTLQSDEMAMDSWVQLAQDKVWQGDLQHRNKEGEYYWVSATISPIQDETGDETTHYLAIMEPKVSM